MAITISLSPANVDSSANNFIYAIATQFPEKVSVAGGDTLDFTQVADKLGSDTIVQVFAESQAGNNGYYVPIAGTALNNWKLMAFAGGGLQLAAGAYPADVVQFSITARKLL